MRICTMSWTTIVFSLGLGAGVVFSCTFLLWNNAVDTVSNEQKSLMLLEEMTTNNPTIPGQQQQQQEEEEEALLGSGAKCLNFENSFDDLVASSGSIYLTMPSKAASTSFNTFVQNCVGLGTIDNNNNLNQIQTEEDYAMNKFVRDLEHPKIIHNHVFVDEPLIRLFDQTPRDSLIIYSYREETDRVMSAARHIITQKCKSDRFVVNNMRTTTGDGSSKEDNNNNSINKCTFEEELIVDMILKPKTMELDGGAPDIMTCDFYDAIKANFPRMVFVHYKQAEKVQRVLSKYHCPNIDKVFYENNSKEKKDVEVQIRLAKSREVVSLEDWLVAKRDKIEWTFQYNRGNKCRGKTRNMEDDLFACKDEIMQVTRDTSF